MRGPSNGLAEALGDKRSISGSASHSPLPGVPFSLSYHKLYPYATCQISKVYSRQAEPREVCSLLLVSHALCTFPFTCTFTSLCCCSCCCCCLSQRCQSYGEYSRCRRPKMYATFSRPRRPRYVNCKSCAPVGTRSERKKKNFKNFDVASFGFHFFFYFSRYFSVPH